MPEVSTPPATGRFAKWDNLKAILIFLVVFCHLFRPAYNDYPILKTVFFYIYLFHMPAFIFVSGLFSKNAVKKRNYDRVFSFLMVYLVTKFVALIPNFALGKSPFVTLFSEGGVAWYAFAMAAFLLMTMFLERYHPAYVIIASIVLGCLAGYCEDVGTAGVASRILYFYPFFLAGYYLNPEQIIKTTNRWYVRLLSLAVLAVACWLCFQHQQLLTDSYYITFLKGRDTFEDLQDLAAYGGLMRLGLYAISFLLIFCLVSVVPNCHIPVVSTVGRRTLAVYSLHYLAIKFFYWVVVLEELLPARFPHLYGLAYAVISLLIVLLFSSRPFDWLVTKLTTPPLRKPIEQKGSGDV